MTEKKNSDRPKTKSNQRQGYTNVKIIYITITHITQVIGNQRVKS